MPDDPNNKITPEGADTTRRFVRALLDPGDPGDTIEDRLAKHGVEIVKPRRPLYQRLYFRPNDWIIYILLALILWRVW